MEKKQYGAIDLMKFIAAFLVVPGHIFPFSGSEGIFRDGICRIVPAFFFCCSGFFLEQKMHIRDRKGVFAYVRRIAILFLIWGLVYALPRYLNMAPGTTFWAYLKNYLLWLLRKGVFWYLSAMLVAIPILWGIRRWMPLWAATVLFGLLFLLGIFGDSYYGLMGYLPRPLEVLLQEYLRIFRTVHDGVFFAPLFLCIGAWFWQSRDGLPIRRGVNAGLFGLALAGMFVESWILRKNGIARDCNMYLLVVPESIFLFNLLIHCEGPGPKTAGFLRKCSTVVYCFHVFAGWAIDRILKAWDIAPPQRSGLVFGLACLASLGVAFAVVSLSQKRGLRFLRYLY